MDINHIKPFDSENKLKSKYLLDELKKLCIHHSSKSDEYRRILKILNYDLNNISKIEEIPFLPVGIFKNLDLKSISEEEVFRIMRSSGTGSSGLSKIYLDKETASLQTRILKNILYDFLGKKRRPLLVIDSPSVLKDKNLFSARGAAIIGFSMFGKKITYALDENYNINHSVLEEFLKTNANNDILIFGFTFLVYKNFLLQLEKNNLKYDLSNAFLLHGGGWKKLLNEKISNKEFKKKFLETCKLSSIHDYYGMIEQTGSINVECRYGHLHTSIYNDIIIRDPYDFSPLEFGNEGLIQLISTIPKSYPGQSILTEDIGVVLGEDDCLCGRKGKYFKVIGRMKNAEIRGCSDAT